MSTVAPAPYQHLRDVPDHVSTRALMRYLRQQWPEGTLRMLDVDGFDVPLVFAGDRGPPVLFVHGLGHDLSDWTPLFRRRQTGRFAALDLPGFGCATLPSDGARLHDLISAVAAAVAACGEPPLLVGSSLGGHVVQLAALLGVPCAGLFLLAPGGFQDPGLLAAQTARTLFAAPRLVQRSEAEIRLVNDALYLDADARDRGLTRRIAMHRSARAGGYAASVASIVDDVFGNLIHERALKLSVPTTFIFGAHDKVVARAPVEAMAQRMRAPVHVLPRAGHVPMLDAPDATMTLLNDFIAQCFPTIQQAQDTRGGQNVGW